MLSRVTAPASGSLRFPRPPFSVRPNSLAKWRGVFPRESFTFKSVSPVSITVSYKFKPSPFGRGLKFYEGLPSWISTPPPNGRGRKLIHDGMSRAVRGLTGIISVTLRAPHASKSSCSWDPPRRLRIMLPCCGFFLKGTLLLISTVS